MYIRGYGVLPYEEKVTVEVENVLSSLEVSGVTLTPEFDPYVTEYSVTVPNEVERLELSASAPDGVEVTVESQDLKEGEVSEIRVIAEGGAGEARTYILRVMREAAEEAPEDESEIPESAPPEEDDVEINDEEIAPDTEEGSTESESGSSASEEQGEDESEAVAQGCETSLDGTSAIAAICFVFCIAWVGKRSRA